MSGTLGYLWDNTTWHPACLVEVACEALAEAQWRTPGHSRPGVTLAQWGRLNADDPEFGIVLPLIGEEVTGVCIDCGRPLDPIEEAKQRHPAGKGLLST